MRTTLDLPDPLFKHLKAQAAMEGRTLRDLVVMLVERGLQAPTSSMPQSSSLPSVELGAPMAMKASQLNNANLASFLDE
jgi:hypothetical protein